MYTPDFTLLALGLFMSSLIFSAYAHTDLSANELVEHHHNLKRDGEALARCLETPEMRRNHARMLVHRDQTLHRIRKARDINNHADIPKRDAPAVTKWAALNHSQGAGHSQDPQDLFDFRWEEEPTANSSGCILTPKSLYGPYWIEGQPERADIRDDQEGIYLRLAIQVIDIATCTPLEGTQVDVWHANALGDYSTVKDGYLRGWQSTSPYGTVDFDSNFPGHYWGRATHIHTVVRAPYEQRVAHFGQIYFDQWLINEIEKTDQYINNDKALLENLKDDWLPSDASDDHDPFVRWSKIGSSPQDGVLAWITLGVNTTDYDVWQPPVPQSDQKRDAIDWHLD